MELNGPARIIRSVGTCNRMKDQEISSENELLRLMRTGDEDAFTAVYRRCHPGVYRFAFQMCGSQPLAEDVTQEVFLILIRRSETFDPARGSLKNFLYGIARNQLSNRLRREKFYVPMEGENGAGHEFPDGVPNAQEKLSRNEAIESLRKAVLSLPERYREVVVLCELEELSYAETAAVLECSVGTVRSRLHRARALLVEKLRPLKTEPATAAKSVRCFA
jgi:RNA polymerase sigma-70 factor (ECF subfamily)